MSLELSVSLSNLLVSSIVSSLDRVLKRLLLLELFLSQNTADESDEESKKNKVVSHFGCLPIRKDSLLYQTYFADLDSSKYLFHFEKTLELDMI